MITCTSTHCGLNTYLLKLNKFGSGVKFNASHSFKLNRTTVRGGGGVGGLESIFPVNLHIVSL